MARAINLTWAPPSGPSLTPRNIIIVGNSTSAPGLGDWPVVFAANHPQSNVINVSFGGARTDSFTGTGFAGAITNNLSSTLPNEIIFFEGANQLDLNFNDGLGHSFGFGYTTGAQAYAVTTTFCAQVRATSPLARIYMCTIDHWLDPDYNQPAFNAGVDGYNAALLAATSDRDRLIDFAGRSGFDPENDAVNQYYTTDTGERIHKTAKGIAAMGAFFSMAYDQVNG